MRIVSKGGVWKNTEDEILKAAVMKYGKNQWARISSLLVRKSAKQCKARWYEWLDPSIKKTEWSREEEEKLLHLAKIMPNQWKTIAPIVGRTASQCLEHYEKLLDAAQNKETYDPAEDPRRLRPGEIDPNPESKPARPDPIDMDEDEKEMLSEARARLANTKGKKAKRKMREKQLEEARRLAALQKRRELKAAGIEAPKPKKKVKGIDYNKEIPFFKKPPPGFYEVNFDEDKKNQLEIDKVTLDQLEVKRKSEAKEEETKKLAKKKQKLMEKNLPLAIMQINKLNEPQQVQTRHKMMLPNPQLGEQELEELAKMEDQILQPSDLEEGTKVTKNLLQSYSATPTPARISMRTPLPSRTPAKEDTVLKEAQNLVALTTIQTPLLGGENPELHPSDFSSATPKPIQIQTPNILATPFREKTLGTKDSFSTPLRTPLRDKLTINNEEPINNEVLLSKKEEKERQKNLKKTLLEGLKSLPAPQNEYKIILPELPEESEEREKILTEEDESERIKKMERLQQEKEALKLRLRSQVLKRNLPRPILIPKSFSEFTSKAQDLFIKQAEELVRKEMINFIIYETMEYPFKQAKIKPVDLKFEEYTEDELEKAKKLVIEETNEIKKKFNIKDYSPEELEKAWLETHEEMMFVPSQKKFVRTSTSSKKDKIESFSSEFEIIRSKMSQEAQRAKKLENKIETYTKGYQTRAENLLKQIHQLFIQIDQSTIELECYKKLRENELKSIPKRIEELQLLVKQQQEREEQNQLNYQNLLIEKNQLLIQTKSS